MLEFVKRYYEPSILLKNRFKITEKKDWDYLTVNNELLVQIGHVFTIESNNKNITEDYRRIENIGDEISDIIFQLILLTYYLQYNIDFIEHNCEEATLESFIIVLGQCSEALLEKSKLRFYKKRPGYETTDDYIKHKISQLFSIIYNFSIEKKVEIYKEYNLMLVDANNFLNNYIEKD